MQSGTGLGPVRIPCYYFLLAIGPLFQGPVFSQCQLAWLAMPLCLGDLLSASVRGEGLVLGSSNRQTRDEMT